MTSRSYQSQVREAGAQRTRSLIAEAAGRLFLSQGYAETSMAAIAREAGVSAQTVYNSFGSKADLLKFLYDVTLVGDDNPIPFAQRPEVIDLYQRSDARHFLMGYAEIGLTLLNRLGPLMQVIRAGAMAGNADLIAHLDKIAGERLIGVTMTVRRLQQLQPLRQGVTAERARDAIWMLNSVEVWQLLTLDRGWSGAQYAAWVGNAMADATLD